MTLLKRLQVSHLRNIRSLSLETFSPAINIIYGENGSGKTSLLEAISLLGLGRSFRSHKTRSLIHQDHPALVVFSDVGENDNHFSSMGVQKNRNGETSIRLEGTPVKTAVSLAKRLPLQIINADTIALIEGSPQSRRRFLDWMTFHVKPSFIAEWQRFQRVIKQRNQLLKRGKMLPPAEITFWDKELASLAHGIHTLRQDVFDAFLSVYERICSQLSTHIADVRPIYHPGWDVEREFKHILQEDFNRDCRDGYTHNGPQRADIRFTLHEKPAVDVLSRGQKKSLVCAMHITQGYLYQQATSKKCIFLIDDLLAELDQHNARSLASGLSDLGSQVFVTGIEKNDLLNIWPEQQHHIHVFHVKHGQVVLEPL